MRYLISVFLLTALIVGWQRPAVAQADVTGTVSEVGGDFVLRWPEHGRARACIVIPQAAIGTTPDWKVNPGTVVTISKLTGSIECEDIPTEFCDHEKKGKRVFRPIMEFSANPFIDLGDDRKHITIAMCGQYAPGTRGPSTQLDAVTRSTGAELEAWEVVPVPPACALRCPGAKTASNGSGTGYLRQLFAGSPFTATPLYAYPEEGGLGGGGGSLSPFAVVEK